MSREAPAAIKAVAVHQAVRQEALAASEHVAACLAVVKADRKFGRKVRTTWNMTAIGHARDERRDAILHSEVTATTWRIADAAIQYIKANEDSQ